MSLSRTRYRAVRAESVSGGKHIRILADVEGPHADLRGDLPRHVERMSEEQARELRDSLEEVLD